MSDDRDISTSDWNRYIKKQYGKKYRIFRDEIGIWSIKCRYGFIQPYSIVEKKLVAVLTYKSGRGITALKKNLRLETAPASRIVQDGDYEVSIAFAEKDAFYFAELLHFGTKRQVSERERKILAEQLKKARLKILRL
jgi:hypothetical protein